MKSISPSFLSPIFFILIRFCVLAADVTIEMINEWGVDDVIKWAKQEKLAKIVIDAFEEHGIVGCMLVEGINDQDLNEMNITASIVRRATLAHIKRLLEKGNKMI